MRKLVDAYYSNEFSFGGFMKQHPQHQGNLTDLLIGRIFHDEAGNIFRDMDLAIANAQSASSEVSTQDEAMVRSTT